MVVVLVVEVALRCTAVQLAPHTPCALAPFRRMVAVVGTVELVCMVPAVLVEVGSFLLHLLDDIS